MSSPQPWGGGPYPTAPHPNAPQPSAPYPGPSGPAGPAPGPGIPPPPGAVLAAAALAVLGVIGLAVVSAVADLGDLLATLEWRAGDEALLVAVLSTVLGAGLLAGAVAALLRRGGNLLRASGGGLAAASLVVLVLEVIQDGDVLRVVVGAGLTAVGLAVGVLAGMAPALRWYELGERAAAERAIERALAGGEVRNGRIPGRDIGWTLGAAALGVVLVAATAIVVAQLAPPPVGEGRAWDGDAALVDEAGEIPVDPSDYEWDRDLARLAEDCADGSFDACDDLYLDSDLGSDYEEYGNSCGGRTEDWQYGGCAQRFD